MRKQLLASIALAILSLECVASVVQAASPNTTVAQSYSAGSSVLSGMLVQLEDNSSSVVEPLGTKDISKMLGVVVPVNDAPIVLSSGSSRSQQVLVATSGKYNILVSNQNGAIKSGDRLTISAIAGVAMKASTAQAEEVGQAEANFNGSSNVLGSETLKNSNGKDVTENISSIPVSVGLGINPNYSKSSSILPDFISKAAIELANKPVSNIHIILAGITLIATIILSTSLLYGAARSRIIAIGRNPLAKSAIGRGLVQIVSSGVVIFVIGLLISYLLLKI
jgi:hypothetical protein